MDEVPSTTHIDAAADDFRSGIVGGSPLRGIDREKQIKYAVSTYDSGERRYVDEQGYWWRAIVNAKLFKTKAEATVAAKTHGGEPVRITVNYVAENLE